MFQEFARHEDREADIRSLGADDQVTRVGRGAIWELGRMARHAGITKALLLLDNRLAQGGAAFAVEASLDEAGIEATRHIGITPTPLVSDATAAVRHAAASGCNGVVSLGGGSTTDVGKAVALLGANGGTVHDWAHGDAVPPRVWPHITATSTAGTGAESSPYAFLLEDHGREHTILQDDCLRPTGVVLDPLIHASMPRRLTATSGMNALAGAIEAYLAGQHTARSDEAALRAVRGVANHLPAAWDDGNNLEARTGMAEASYWSGRAFGEAGLGVLDSISLTLSGFLAIGHSEANAILLPHVMAYDALSAEPDRLQDLADLLAGPDRPPQTAARQATDGRDAAIAAVVRLQERIDCPRDLTRAGVSWDDIYLCAGHLINHPFAKRAARALDADGVQSILVGALEAGAQAPRGTQGRSISTVSA